MRANLSTLRAGLLGAGFPPISDDEVRGIRAPVLLVTGEHSPRVLVRLTDLLEELLRNVERVEIRGASHLMHEDDPPAVHAAIVGFLERARGPAPASAARGARSR
jgi:pimeloyl-ACP methyl ester carboxylesterase